MTAHSNLWKFVQLWKNSQYFPLLVEAACVQVGLEFTPDVVKSVALNPTFLASLPYNRGESIDESIDVVLYDPVKAQALDNDILYLVTQMKGK